MMSQERQNKSCEFESGSTPLLGLSDQPVAGRRDAAFKFKKFSIDEEGETNKHTFL